MVWKRCAAARCRPPRTSAFCTFRSYGKDPCTTAMGRIRVYPIVSFEDALSDRQVSGRPIATTVRWCRPTTVVSRSDLAAAKPPFGSERRHPKEVPQRRAHIGPQHTGQLRRGGRSESVRDTPTGPILHTIGRHPPAGAGWHPALLRASPARGILAHGFRRLRCGECGHDKLPALQLQAPGVLPVVRRAALPPGEHNDLCL